MYQNSLFTQTFGSVNAGYSLADLFAEPGQYSAVIQKCVENGSDPVPAILSMKVPGGTSQPVRWEFSRCQTIDRNEACIQAVGLFDYEEKAELVSAGRRVGTFAERYKAYEQSPEGLWRFDSMVPVPAMAEPNTIIEHWRKYSFLAECNDRMANMYGFEKAGELKGVMLEQLIDFSDENRVNNLRKFILNGFRPMLVETKEFDRYGNTRYFLNSMEGIVENGYLSTVWGTQQDITEQRLAEERLEKSELFYRNLIAESLDGILLTDENGMIRFVSPSVTNILGYEPAQLMGKSVFDFVYPEDRQEALTAFTEEVKMQPKVKFIYTRLIRIDGTVLWCMVRGHNMLLNPNVASIIIYFNDDTKRKQMEDRLRESESRFRNMIHNLKLGIILHNERTEILISNQAALDMLGLRSDQLLGKTFFDLRWNVIREDGSVFPWEELPVPRAIRTGQPVKDVVMGVYRPVSNDRIWLLVNADLIFNEEQQVINVISSFSDITEQRMLSQQLIEQEIQKQKLITQATIDGQEKERLEIGKELHDNINQHLTTTRLYLEVAAEKASGDVLDMINMAHKNLADIVNEIRRLSQSLVPPTLGDLGLTESIQDLCDSLRRTHSYRIEFQHRHFSEDELPENMKLMIFRIIQEQVNNIIRHARARTIIIKLQSDAENIILSIADDGQGFDLQRNKKGMGFSNMSNRAGLFAGRVEIDARPGQGCTVMVTIPVAGGSAE